MDLTSAPMSLSAVLQEADDQFNRRSTMYAGGLAKYNSPQMPQPNHTTDSFNDDNCIPLNLMVTVQLIKQSSYCNL